MTFSRKFGLVTPAHFLIEDKISIEQTADECGFL